MKVDLYVILFHESLNDIAQKCQMDVCIRFIQDDNVQIHYLTTKFLQRTRAGNLLDAFEVLRLALKI